jgi:hypothetical protein
MPTVTSYSTLVQAIQDFTHRPDLASYVDYFIQSALEAIGDDIFAENFGRGVQWMEAAYPATAISANGTAPVPSDYLAPKIMTVSAFNGQFRLRFKPTSWIYERYPYRQADGVPAYIAKDQGTSGGSFTQVTPLTATATAGQTTFATSWPAGTQVLLVSLDGAVLVPTTDYTYSGSAIGLTNAALAGQTLYAVPASVTYGTSGVSSTAVFIFGPFPDSAYTIQGTYYQAIPALSSGSPTNWLIQTAPMLLLYACLLQAAPFLKDAQQIAMWQAIYTQRLQALILRDRAQTHGAGALTMV